MKLQYDKILYVNNYRGFEDCYIPLKKVNFLVGENSTGKSSILSIIRLLSSFEFWYQNEFNNEEVELGSFSEIVNVNLKGKKQFQVGFHSRIDSESRYRSPITTLIATYTNEKSTPKLSEFKFLHKTHTFYVNILTGSYNVQKSSLSSSINSLEAFKKWVNDKSYTSEKVHKFKIEETYFKGEVFLNLGSFVSNILEERHFFEKPEFIRFTSWIAPIRTKPKRIYETFKLTPSPDGNHAPLVLKNILEESNKKNIDNAKFLKIIEKFGRESGLFDKINIQHFGSKNSSTFALNIFIDGKPLRITNVGYGVGQVLPLLTDLVRNNIDDVWYLIQQPEVHLHPKAQAALGNIIYNSMLDRQVGYMIETHSDFIINRFRQCVAKGKKSVDSQVLFFDRKNGRNMVYTIDIDQDGLYDVNQPDGFRKFFIQEELNLLSL